MRYHLVVVGRPGETQYFWAPERTGFILPGAPIRAHSSFLEETVTNANASAETEERATRLEAC